MDLQAAILKRRSVRAFAPTPIDDAILTELLQMAQAAPSGGNGQAHLFGIIKDPQLKIALAKAAGNQLWIADAPVVIACCAHLPEDMNALPEDDFGLAVNRLRWGEPLLQYLLDYPRWNDMALLFANPTPLLGAQHMFLAAVTHGLSGCFIGWLDVKEAGRILNLPKDIACLFLLPLGYPAEPPRPKELKPLSQLAFFDIYSQNNEDSL